MQGYIRIRNEDGTQWLSFFKARNSRGRACWSWDHNKIRARLCTQLEFEQLKTEQARSIAENGYMGMYNLEFVEA
jgi:hypothetical protein